MRFQKYLTTRKHKLFLSEIFAKQKHIMSSIELVVELLKK